LVGTPFSKTKVYHNWIRGLRTGNAAQPGAPSWVSPSVREEKCNKKWKTNDVASEA
jgi:hypothetical protein